MTYTFRWKHRRHWFWRKEKEVLHHSLQQSGHLVIEFKDGRIKEIPFWHECYGEVSAEFKKRQRKVVAHQMQNPINFQVVRE